MFISIMLVVVALLLIRIARGLWIINENLRQGIHTNSRNHSELIVLLRGTKVSTEEIANGVTKVAKNSRWR